MAKPQVGLLLTAVLALGLAQSSQDEPMMGDFASRLTGLMQSSEGETPMGNLMSRLMGSGSARPSMDSLMSRLSSGMGGLMGRERNLGDCELVGKSTLSEARGEPVRNLTFRAPPGTTVNVDTALRQVVVVRAFGGLRMYSPTSEPNRSDGTFDIVVRVYENGKVSRWLDEVALGAKVPMIWPWPAPLRADRRNPGVRVGLIAFGIGVTELYRVAVSELRDPGVQTVVLLYATRSKEEQEVMNPELLDLEARHEGRFRLERTLSRECAAGFRSGRVDAAMFADVFPWADANRANVRFLPSGTREMMKDAMAMLDGLGYDRQTYQLIRDNPLPGMLR